MLKNLLQKLFPSLYPQEDKLYTMWKSTIDMRLRPQHIPFPLGEKKLPRFFDFRSPEEMKHEADLDRWKGRPFLLRIFYKKPFLVEDAINCRCASPDIMSEESCN